MLSLKQKAQSYLVNHWNDGTTSLLTFICTEKKTKKHQSPDHAKQYCVTYKNTIRNKQYILTINMEPQKINKSINILQKINS